MHIMRTMMHRRHIASRERIAAALGAAASALAAHPDPLPAIDRAVAERYLVAARALASRRRDGALPAARRVAWALAWAGARQPLAALRRRYGGRPGSGIVRAVGTVADDLAGGRLAAAELAALARAACSGRPVSPPAAAPRPARRACLACGAPFVSQGAHNRLCDACREDHAGEPDACAVHCSLDGLA